MKITGLLFVAGLISLTKAEKVKFKTAFREILVDYEKIYRKHTESEVRELNIAV